MGMVDILNSSATCEWFTPAKYVEAARLVLGRIELDPASCLLANETVRAERIYTQETDGLAHEWIAETVFLNPPYGKDERGRSMQAVWSRKLVSEYLAGRTKEAILLLNASTSEKWFLPLWDYPICFTDHRVRFVGAPLKNAPTKGNAFIYFGSNVPKFVNEFSQFGTCIGRISDFPAMPVTSEVTR